MSFCIRPMEATDLAIAKAIVTSYVDELSQLNAEAAEHFEQAADDDLSNFNRVRKNYFRNGGVLNAMTDRDRLVGMGGLRRISSDVCELRLLLLHRAFRGRGLGHEMALSLIEWAKENEFQSMRVDVSNYQPDAIKLLSAMRFMALEPVGHGLALAAPEQTYELDLRRKGRVII